MKRIISVILCCLVVIMCGCTHNDRKTTDNEEEITLTVLSEVDEGTIGFANVFATFYEYMYPNVNVEIETLSLKPDVRSSQIQRYKTEIVAGKGPDVFILQLDPDEWENVGAPNERLFANFDKVMRSGAFLPLDEYIGNSEYIDMESLVEPIMNAGRTSEGQVVMPMSYTFSVIIPDERVQDVPVFKNFYEFMSWDYGASLLKSDHTMMSSGLVDIADYDSEKLVVSEEYVTDLVKRYCDIVKDSAFGGSSAYIYPQAGDWEFWELKNEWEETDIIPILNTDGGITARITTCMAINRSTDEADAAFKFLELYYSDYIQSRKGFYIEEEGQYIGSDELITSHTFFPDISVSNLNYMDEVYGEFIYEVNSKISSVKFDSNFEDMVTELWKEVLLSSGYLDVEKTVNEFMTDYKMILAE